VNRLLGRVLRCANIALYTWIESSGHYPSSFCTLSAISNYDLLWINAHYPLVLLSPCSDNQFGWTSSEQMESLWSSTLSRPTVSFWYTSPDWLVSIGLLSSGPSTSLYHSITFLQIVLKYLRPTGPSTCQSRVTQYRGDDGWRHSVSLSIENIAMCVGTPLKLWQHSRVGDDDVVEWFVPGGH